MPGDEEVPGTFKVPGTLPYPPFSIDCPREASFYTRERFFAGVIVKMTGYAF